jgi:hypothetical protein
MIGRRILHRGGGAVRAVLADGRRHAVHARHIDEARRGDVDAERADERQRRDVGQHLVAEGVRYQDVRRRAVHDRIVQHVRRVRDRIAGLGDGGQQQRHGVVFVEHLLALDAERPGRQRIDERRHPGRARGDELHEPRSRHLQCRAPDLGLDRDGHRAHDPAERAAAPVDAAAVELRRIAAGGGCQGRQIELRALDEAHQARLIEHRLPEVIAHLHEIGEAREERHRER